MLNTYIRKEQRSETHDGRRKQAEEGRARVRSRHPDLEDWEEAGGSVGGGPAVTRWVRGPEMQGSRAS